MLGGAVPGIGSGRLMARLGLVAVAGGGGDAACSRPGASLETVRARYYPVQMHQITIL